MNADRRSCLWHLGAAGAAAPALAGLSAVALLTAGPAAGADEPGLALKAGGVVAVFRHALAPGTYDPPGMRLADCATQRNLNEEGRRQAVRLGAWFSERGLRPARVRSSPWCRCIDTARGAFGRAELWEPLGSPVGAGEDRPADAPQLLRRALAEQAHGTFDVWITHNFIISELTGISADSAGGVVLRGGNGRGPIRTIARIEAV